MHNDWIRRRPALGGKNRFDRRDIQSICAEAVHRFGGKGDQADTSQHVGRFANHRRLRLIRRNAPHNCRSGIEHLQAIAETDGENAEGRKQKAEFRTSESGVFIFRQPPAAYRLLPAAYRRSPLPGATH